MNTKIEEIIKEYVKKYPENKKTQSRWEEPLVAFADASDNYFYKLKELVSSTHAMPQDFLTDAKTVITYFLPFTTSIIKSNIKGDISSKEWVIAYVETNKLIYDINKYMQQKMEDLGFKATIIPATHNFNEEKLISDWSHRHVAYIAGLGKFGLNNMLITEKGCCGRIGSIVTNLKLEATERPNNEFCLYKKNGSCKVCVDRCVNNALSADEFDRHKCYELCLYNDKLNDIGPAKVCGKCLVNLPCSFSNPVDYNEI